MSKKRILLITIILLILVFGPITILATETNNEEGTIAGELSNEMDENQEKIDELRKSIQEKVEEKLNSIINDQERRSWIGIIKEKMETGFKLESGDKTRTVTINDEVVIINEKRKSIEFDDLEVNQRLVAMGYAQIDNTLEAKRIVLLPKAVERKIKVIFGTIKDKSEENEILLVTTHDEQEYELILGKETKLKQRVENKMEEIKYQEIKTGQKIIAVITPTKSNSSTYDVKSVLVISPSPAPTE